MEREWCQHCTKPKEHQIVNGQLIVWCSYCLDLKCITRNCNGKRKSKRAKYCTGCKRKRHSCRTVAERRLRWERALSVVGGKRIRTNPKISNLQRKINTLKVRAYRKTEKGKQAMKKANNKSYNRLKTLYAQAKANGQASTSSLLSNELSQLHSKIS